MTTYPSLNSDLAGKTIFVTGAASGIGEGLARGLGEVGAKVILADLNLDRARQISEEIGNGSSAVRLDAGREPSIEMAFSGVNELHGLVNVAGILTRVPLLEMRAADFDKVININLRGYILCAREAAKKIIATGSGVGSIVNICSTNAHKSTKRLIHYSASKGGILSATRGMALELAEHGIRVNSVSPGVVATNLNAARLADPAQLAKSAGQTALGRVGLPKDLVGIVELLLSERSSWITGIDMLVDGGEFAG